MGSSFPESLPHMTPEPDQQPRADPVPAPSQARGEIQAWASPAFSQALGAGGLESGLSQLFGLQPESWLRRVPGRETFAWPGREAWIVKRTVGGESKDYWYERLRGEARSPARRELENLVALATQGFPVPTGLAWFGEPRAAGHPRRGGRSAMVMGRVEHRGSLREVLARAEAGEAAELLRQLSSLVIELHRAGWIHRDLYLQHFVVGEHGLVILDVGRARQRPAPRERWFVKDLAALHFSAPAGLGRCARLRFLRRWLEARGSTSRAERRRWVKRITRRGRRMAGHRPKHLDAGDPVDAELFP